MRQTDEVRGMAVGWLGWSEKYRLAHLAQMTYKYTMINFKEQDLSTLCYISPLCYINPSYSYFINICVSYLFRMLLRRSVTFNQLGSVQCSHKGIPKLTFLDIIL